MFEINFVLYLTSLICLDLYLRWRERFKLGKVVINTTTLMFYKFLFLTVAPSIYYLTVNRIKSVFALFFSLCAYLVKISVIQLESITVGAVHARPSPAGESAVANGDRRRPRSFTCKLTISSYNLKFISIRIKL